MNARPTYDELYAKVEKLEEKNRVYQSLAENTSDLLYRTDLDGVIIYISRSVNELSGYSVEEAIGLNMAREVYLVPEEREVFLKLLRQHGRVINFEARLKRKDGSIWWASTDAHFYKDEDGNVMGVEGITRDITELKRSREALANSEQLLADIIDFLPDPTFVIDINHRVISWNRAIESLSGITKAEIMGQGGYQYAVPFYGKPRPMLIDLVLNRDSGFENEYLTLKEGDLHNLIGETFHPNLGVNGKYFTSTASRIYNVQGKIIGAIESIRDATQIKESQREKENLITELRESIAKVNTLSGLLPICASCKKIRDTEGYWNQIESYIEAHSEAEFSHGLCEDCAREMYKDTSWYNKSHGEKTD